MAQQTTQAAGSGQIEAVAKPGTDRTHFLHGISKYGNETHFPIIGGRATEASVLVWDDAQMDTEKVSLHLSIGDFDLRTHLTPHEAQALGAALLMAADHAQAHTDELELNRDIAVAMAAAEVAA